MTAIDIGIVDEKSAGSMDIEEREEEGDYIAALEREDGIGRAMIPLGLCV
jgi:hypothetical protein